MKPPHTKKKTADYTRERCEWLNNKSVQTVAKRIRTRKKKHA
jgi:hypothetical protein